MSVNPGSIKKQSQITMKIGGETLSGWEGLTVELCIDAAANAFSFRLPWNPITKNRERFRPYGLQIIKIFLDNTEILTGYIEKPEFETSIGSRSVTLQGRSASGPMVEMSAGPPFQFSNIMFNALSRKLYQALDPSAAVGIVYANPDFGPVGEVSIDPGQTMWDVLSRLASAHGLWGRPLAGGRLEFTNFPSTQIPMAYIEEGIGPVRSIRTSHDATKRFQRYMVIGTYEGEPGTESEVADYELLGLAKRGRQIQQLDQQTIDISKAAKFARSRALIDSYICTAEVDGWHYNGTVWTPGKTVTVKAPGAFIEKETPLIIRKASLSIDESGGQMSTLDLGLPQAFDNSEINTGALPWVG